MAITNCQFECDEASVVALDEIANNMEVDRAIVLREAVAQYLVNYEEEKAIIEEAERQLDAGLGIAHEEVIHRYLSRATNAPTTQAA